MVTQRSLKPYPSEGVILGSNPSTATTKFNLMKNLLNDPEVLKLYQALQNKKFKDLDDYLTSSPIDEISEQNCIFPTPRKSQESKIFFGGEEIRDFEGDNDYGL